MTEDEFRAKYPHSSDEQVRLYLEAVAAEKEQGVVPTEPDIPMPLIVAEGGGVEPQRFDVPYRFSGPAAGHPAAPSYTLLPLSDIPPEAEPTCTADEMRQVILRNFKVTPEQRQRLESEDMTENDMLALLAGVPSEREFQSLA